MKDDETMKIDDDSTIWYVNNKTGAMRHHPEMSKTENGCVMISFGWITPLPPIIDELLRKNII